MKDKYNIEKALNRFKELVESLECECDSYNGVPCSIHKDRILAKNALDDFNGVDGGVITEKYIRKNTVELNIELDVDKIRHILLENVCWFIQQWIDRPLCSNRSDLLRRLAQALAKADIIKIDGKTITMLKDDMNRNYIREDTAALDIKLDVNEIRHILLEIRDWFIQQWKDKPLSEEGSNRSDFKIELDERINESKIKEAIEVADKELYTLNAYLENKEFTFHRERFRKMMKALYTFKDLVQFLAQADVIKMEKDG